MRKCSGPYPNGIIPIIELDEAEKIVEVKKTSRKWPKLIFQYMKLLLIEETLLLDIKKK